MAKFAMQQNVRDRWLSTDGVYATLIIVWIITIWVVAFYVAADAAADAGGNSFLLACSLATAGVFTGFSVKEFLGAYNRCRRKRP